MQATAGLWRGSTLQTLRLVSGLVLFVFAATHFLNHALGLVSLDAMLVFENARVAATRSIVGSVVLLSALLVHAGLGLWSVLRRRTWAMPVWQWVQAASGIAIPVLLLPHIVNTRVATALVGVRTTYIYEVPRIWPATMIDQSVLLLLVWVHGCIGLHYWLRLSARYRLIQPALYAIAIILPFAALAGVSVQGRLAEKIMADPAAAAAIKAAVGWPDAAQAATLASIRENARAVYAMIAIFIGLAAGWGVLMTMRRRRIPVRYVGGPLVRTEPGSTLLDISRRNNVPHVSVCGGRGRCSTCRTLILNQGAGVKPPDEAERKTLKSIGAGPHVRLACQTIPTGAVTVMPLLTAEATNSAAAPGAPVVAGDGVERDLAVLFVDLRGFTALTDRKLPFDVIYILNQFFSAVGQPIHNCGGWIVNYAGDGVIALFGDDRGMAAACHAAMQATIEIDRAITILGYRLLEETRAPLRVAMGLHAGSHVMGRVGFGTTQPLSVVGLAMNVASRLESLAKERSVQLALSGTVARFGGLNTRGLKSEPIDVRGVSEPIDVIFVSAAGDLVSRLAPTPDMPTMLARSALP